MRPVRLARIAAEAEVVRLRGLLSRMAIRVVLVFIALFFVGCAVVFGHVAAWYELTLGLGLSPLVTAGILAGADLLLAIALGFVASRSSPSRVELEAYEVRTRAIEGLRSPMNLLPVAVPALRSVLALRRRRRA